jgi:hypothetical protein
MLTNNTNKPNATSASTRTLTMLGVAFMVAGLAMFMWWKMRMVTGVPRTAYADPKQVDSHQPPQPALSNAQEPHHADHAEPAQQP